MRSNIGANDENPLEDGRNPGGDILDNNVGWRILDNRPLFLCLSPAYRMNHCTMDLLITSHQDEIIRSSLYAYATLGIWIKNGKLVYRIKTVYNL